MIACLKQLDTRWGLKKINSNMKAKDIYYKTQHLFNRNITNHVFRFTKRALPEKQRCLGLGWIPNGDMPSCHRNTRNYTTTVYCPMGWKCYRNKLVGHHNTIIRQCFTASHINFYWEPQKHKFNSTPHMHKGHTHTTHAHTRFSVHRLL